jgi:putative peptidoglycan binding protein
MGKKVLVRQGDFLAQIAKDHGFHDPATIWNAPENAQLRQDRPDPNVLLPDDEIFIPDKIDKAVAVASGKRTTFQVGAPGTRLRLRVRSPDGLPLVGAICKVVVAQDAEVTGTNDQGVVDRAMPPLEPNVPRPIAGRLDILDPPFELHLAIGALNPDTDIEGQQARLNNLGYFAGFDPVVVGDPKSDDERLAAQQFKWAVEEFQKDVMKIQPTGIMDAATRAALVAEHGS